MRKFDHINVIPFIDILLVLLAIVLTTATFISNGQLDIALPVASAESEPSEREKVELAIDRDKNFYLDGQQVSFEQIRGKLETLSAETHIMLAIDESVEFGQFVSLIDLLKVLSLDKVSIVTRKNS